MKWRLIAKANGVAEDEKLEVLIASLPDEQVAKAQKAADEWRQKQLMR